MYINKIIQVMLSWSKRRKILYTAGLLLVTAYWFSLPNPLFRNPYSVVLEDRQGQLLAARIAADGQWRFPETEAIPEKYQQALVTFEDQRFYFHPGVDPVAFSRAIWQNIRNRRIVSGGSTLTMQVIRLSRQHTRRTPLQKLIEMVLATRLELRFSKEKILKLYASHAPFGGNVVGLDAASWRYFGKSPSYLSWAESALLAVLPNNPSLLHLSRNRAPLLEKRNRLLHSLAKKGKLDATTLELAIDEPLPDAPLPLPQLAPHLINRTQLDRTTPRVRTTLDISLQTRALEVARRRHDIYKHNGIYNLAALIVSIETGEVQAYIGNAPQAGKDHGEAVDIITAPRSSGSIFKPLLYCLALQEGLISPNSMLTDIPTNINGYRPENFHRDYDGIVPASEALSKSLNIPFVRLLRDYDIARFHRQLRRLGLRDITRAPEHYGLTLILGGAETNLWDIAGVYAGMARTLNHFPSFSGQYSPTDFRPMTYQAAEVAQPSLQRNAPFLEAGALWYTVEAMQEVQRPDSEGAWETFQSSRRVAWKTGTSFGYRDAWSIGITPDYLVAVWVGNADGEGRPGLVGARVAAPFMFDLINLLPAGTPWFPKPFDALKKVPVCQNSGWPAGPNCPATTQYVPRGNTQTPSCTYCQRIHLDASETWQVHADCASPAQMKQKTWMILPALETFYYRQKHPIYQSAPPFRPDCIDASTVSNKPMQLIYPLRNTRIYVPVDLDGTLSRTVFKLAHSNPKVTVFWHLDEVYLGATTTFHTMELNPTSGKHKLTIVDERGNRLEQWFEIAGKAP